MAPTDQTARKSTGSKDPRNQLPTKMKVVDFESPGGPEVLRIREAPIPTIDIDGIMIQVAATGLNIRDTWRRQGIVYSARRSLGSECSGKVVAVGSHVSKFKEGDEVCALLENGGGYAEFVAVQERHVLRIPSGVPLVDAAALPHASCLALYSLSILTKATAGKIVMIHGAAGGIGMIPLQYAKLLGCEVFALAGLDEELRLCESLGADICINYKILDFCRYVKAITRGKGVDIILDFSGKDNFQKNLDCLARGGSLVNFGLKFPSCMNVDFSALMEKDISIIGGDWNTMHSVHKQSLQSDVASKFWPLVEAGYIKPIIGKTFSFPEVGKAHRTFEEYSIPGKLLLVP